jgi:hypothetical protein
MWFLSLRPPPIFVISFFFFFFFFFFVFQMANLILVCGPVEHLMALYSCVLRALPHSAGGFDFIRAFYTTWFDQAFRATDYTLWKAIPLQLSNFVATFTWSYMDMFVTLVSMALTHKYTELYERLLAVRGKVRHTKMYGVRREREKLGEHTKSTVCLEVR